LQRRFMLNQRSKYLQIAFNRSLDEVRDMIAALPASEKIIIEAIDENGNKFKLKADGMLSRVIQHEYDHLCGIEFTEKITDMRKIMSSEEYIKMTFPKKN